MKAKLNSTTKATTNMINKKIIIVSLGIFIYFLYSINSNSLLLVVSIIVGSIYTVIKVRKNSILLIVSILLFYANYSICLFYWADIFHVRNQQSILWFMQDSYVMETALRSFYIFELTILTFLPNKIEPFNTKEKGLLSDSVKNTSIGILMLIIAVAITGLDIYRTYSKGIYSQTSIFEYLNIIYIIGFYYSKHNKLLEGCLITFLVIDSLYIFINGDRGAAIQFILIFYFMFLLDKISNRTLLFCAVIGTMFLTVIGAWRGRQDFTIELVKEAIDSFLSTGVMSDTAYYSAGAGLSFIKMTNDFSSFQRIGMFGTFLLSMIVGSGFLKGYVPLATLSFQLYPYHCFGGFLPCFGFFYLGYFGVVAFGLLVTKVFSTIASIKHNSTVFHKLLCVFWATTAYRWYLYSPSQLLRGALLLFLVYKFSCIFYKSKNVKYTVDQEINNE